MDSDRQQARQSWIPVEVERPDDQLVVAVVCRQSDNGIQRMTGFHDKGRWMILGNYPDLRCVEVSHWCKLPDEIPPYRCGDPIG